MDELVTGLVVLAVIFWVYFAPAAIAFARKVPSAWSIAVINLLLGWTLVGWVVALALAVRTVAKPADSSVPADPAEGLRKLADLRAQGLLTDDEYAAAKSRILG